MPLAVAHGAAVIALTIDEVGMAKTADRKVEIAQRIKEIVCDEHGLDPELLIFDCLTFTLTTGDDEWKPSAIATIEGIRRVTSMDIEFAQELGYRIKLLGLARETRHGIEQRVHPCMVPLDTPILAAADGTVQMIEKVVSDGDLKDVLSIPGYRVAAKTGTAEVAKAGGGGYGSDRIVSVAGLAPAEDPQYVVVVTFTKPSTIKTSAAAAPTFNKIMSQVLEMYRVPPSTEPAPVIPQTW